LGQALPSVQERSKIYEQQGLGSASSYVGSAAQNKKIRVLIGDAIYFIPLYDG